MGIFYSPFDRNGPIEFGQTFVNCTTGMDLEVFDISAAVENGERDVSFCRRLADFLHEAGCIVVRDPRVSIEDNDRFLDLMEAYFSRPVSQKQHQTRPDLHYQVGLTPEGVEIPEAVHDPSTLENIKDIPEEDRPHIPKGPDPKCRYMWRIGPRPSKTDFNELNAGPVVPDGFPEWETVMNRWGEKLLATVNTVAELLGVGLGLDDPSVIAKMTVNAPHLLAPTGVNLSQHRTLDTVIAGYHADFNLLTAHGRARYPGLFLWLRNGKRVPAKVPEGCILIQAGMQLEYLTGGYIKAGMHEVVVSKDTIATLKKAEASRACMWRVSSTLFGHVASDEKLSPFPEFKKKNIDDMYPEILAGKFVAEALKRINLFKRPIADEERQT